MSTKLQQARDLNRVDGETIASLRAQRAELLEALQLLQGFDFRLDDSAHGVEIRRRVLAAIAKAGAA